MGCLCSKELSKGDLIGHARRNPAATTASIITAPMTMGYSLLGAGIGRGIDSYNQSLFADNALQAAGIHATGPRGQDRTTSAWADFFGHDARDQQEGIIEEVKQEIEDAKTWNPTAADIATMNASPTSATNTSGDDFYGGGIYSTARAPVTSTDLNPPGWTGTLTNRDINAQAPFTLEASSLAPASGVTSLSQPTGPETGRFAGQQYGGVVTYPNAVSGYPGMPVTTYDNRVALPGATNVTPGEVDNLIASGWPRSGGANSGTGGALGQIPVQQWNLLTNSGTGGALGQIPVQQWNSLTNSGTGGALGQIPVQQHGLNPNTPGVSNPLSWQNDAILQAMASADDFEQSGGTTTSGDAGTGDTAGTDDAWGGWDWGDDSWSF